VLDTCQIHRRIDRRIVAITRVRKAGKEVCYLVYSFYLDQLPTLVFSNARFVMLIFVCIVKRAGMRATRASEDRFF